MNEALIEFKKGIETYAGKLLSELDRKIAKIEARLSGVESEEEIFFLRKRLARIEINKFGYSLDTNDNDNGKNN